MLRRIIGKANFFQGNFDLPLLPTGTRAKRQAFFCSLCAGLLSVCFLTPTTAMAQLTHTLLRSFGPPEKLGAQPYSEILKGRDGALYGTTVVAGGPVEGAIFKLNGDGTGYRAIYAMAPENKDGSLIYSGLLEGSDDSLYGTAYTGGSDQHGLIYRLNKDGTGYKILKHFKGGLTDSSGSFANLIEGNDGVLYGTSWWGGARTNGTIFKLNKDGSAFQVLHHFTGPKTDGTGPRSTLLLAPDGVLYGVTQTGGSTTNGVVFKLNRDGSGYSIIHDFKGSPGNDGAQPYAGLLLGSDGAFYGTTIIGGSKNLGSVYRVTADGTFTLLYSFAVTAGDGSQPYSRLIEVNGTLYGTTAYGGSADSGTIFKINKDGSGYAVVRSLGLDKPDAAVPFSGLMYDGNGVLWGATAEGGNDGLGTIYRIGIDGANYSVVHRFAGGLNEVATVYGKLLEGSDKALYGMSWYGGTQNRGTVFKANKDGSNFSILYSFDGTNSANPYGSLIEGSDGWLYGTTRQGGYTNMGVAFKLSKEGSNFTVLRQFDRTGGGAAFPYAGFLEGKDGVLYGTTLAGGVVNGGTVYKMNKDGTGYAVLLSFGAGERWGVNPYSRLIEGSDGVLYGTTGAGGAQNLGSVYKIRKDGQGYSIIRHLAGGVNDGSYAYAALLEASDGFLYGTTYSGGKSNLGTIFKLNKNGGGYTLIRHFSGGENDGKGPSQNSELVEGRDGALYGTTSTGGQADQGVVYKINKDGSNFTVVHHFTGDSMNPYSGVIYATDGNFYGATLYGGMGFGTLYRLGISSTLRIATNGELTLSGPAGYQFKIQTQENLNPSGQWQDLTNITLSARPFTFKDPGYGSSAQRFYRSIPR